MRTHSDIALTKLKILDLLILDAHITAQDIAKRMNIDVRTARKYHAELTAKLHHITEDVKLQIEQKTTEKITKNRGLSGIISTWTSK